MGRPPKTPDEENVEMNAPETGMEMELDPSEQLRTENEELRRQMEEMRKQIQALAEREAQPTVVMAKPEETVELVYINAVSPNNTFLLGGGKFGTRHGPVWSASIPKRDFGGEFMTPEMRSALNARHLIVCSGLTDEERERYGVSYRDGELLDTLAFDRLLDMDMVTLKDVFGKLCKEHKKIVAVKFLTAYEKGDNRISREKVEPLNALSKAEDPAGMFKKILEKMNAQSV